MGTESRLGQWLTKISDKLGEQVWFQQLKAKWEELDPQSRTYLKAAAGGGGALLVVVMLLSSMWSVHRLKNEVNEKTALLNMINAANEEMHQLHDSLPGGGAPAPAGGEAPNWSTYLETTANAAGVDKANLDISPEKPGPAGDLAKESLINVTLKKVGIKQVVRFAFQAENGAKPVKVRNLSIDVKDVSAGMMDASLSLSAFAIK
jgi:hypothetical protein